MRVIGGRYGGLQLSGFKADFIRPTTDRVKESLFNILGSSVDQAVVVDLFSGTGNLGIEALSRNAKLVYFVELRSQALEILRENLKKLHVTEGFRVHKKDVFRFLKSRDETEPLPDVILADPPFTEKLAHDLGQAFADSPWVGDQTVVVMESAKRERLDQSYGKLMQFDQRQFGDKNLSFFRRVLP